MYFVDDVYSTQQISKQTALQLPSHSLLVAAVIAQIDLLYVKTHLKYIKSNLLKFVYHLIWNRMLFSF